jgi:dihydropteroate synthase
MARDSTADVAGVTVGPGSPVAVMGVINVSPESFHAGSVYRGDEAVLRAGLAMVEAGAVLIDVGARSTAPYLSTAIDEGEETARLAHTVELLAAKLPVPISADTPRPAPARAALEAGARVINDVSCLRDPVLARLVAAHDASLILMAAPVRAAPAATGRSRARGASHAAVARPRRVNARRSPVATIKDLLAAGLRRARAARIPAHRIVVDPGIGFFRGESVPWPEWDLRVLAGLPALRTLGRPVAVGVSRKSFLGAVLERPDTGDRLAGSLAATAIAVSHGAALIRTHDVAETRDAVRLAQLVRQTRP